MDLCLIDRDRLKARLQQAKLAEAGDSYYHGYNWAMNGAIDLCQPLWRSVDDELPPTGGVFIRYLDYDGGAHYSWALAIEGDTKVINVTHWMPIPPLPEAET